MYSKTLKRAICFLLCTMIALGNLPSVCFASENDEPHEHYTEPTGVEQVQAMIDELPDSMTEDTMETLLAYQDTLDAAIGSLSAEEIILLDMSKYNAIYHAPMTAATETWEYYTNPDGNGNSYAVITGYNGAGGSVTIPNTLGGAKVEGISAYTFYYSDAAVTSLTCGSNLKWFSDVSGLEDSLKTVNFSAATIAEIPSSAFHNCEKLTSFSWPKGVKTVGNGAFYNTGLTSISIPSTVTRLGGETIGTSAGVFESCHKLTSVTINSTKLTQISDSTFKDCTALKTVKLSSSITSIGNNVFDGCTSLTTVKWGTSEVTAIGNYAFADCSALTDLTLPSTLTTLGEYCFCGCGVTSLHLPDSLYHFSGTSFQYATSLSALTVSDTNSRYSAVDGVLFDASGAKLICYPAGKPSVTNYWIPDGVTTIDTDAFGVRFNSQNIYCGHGNISNLYFPDTVKTVAEGGVAYYSGNFYFCGDKPSVADSFALGDFRRVNYYYTPGRVGWICSDNVKEWPNETHCTAKSGATVEPTCTVAGGKEISCPICGYRASDLSGTAALGHDWTEWITTVEPTCTADGQERRSCQREGCIEAETRPIEKSGHKWTSLFCQDDAVCTRCGLERAARDHSWVDISCTEPKHCTLCPLTEGEALGHAVVVDEAQEPTCTAPGKTEGKHCTRCDLILEAQASIPATGHTTVIDPEVPATQNHTGLTEGSHCSTCGVVLVAQTVTAATGYHSKHAACAERCSHEESHEIVTFTRWASGTFSSGNYYMTADITLSRNLTITGNAHLCLNGHTLTFADGYALIVENGGSLTICDCAKNGQIVRGTLQGNGDGSMIVNRGTMIIGGGIFAPDGNGVDLYNTGTLTVFDGTFGIEITNTYDDWSSDTTRYGKVIIHNATIQSDLYSSNYALVNSKGCTMVIYGGAFSATGSALRNLGTVTVQGGKFESLAENSTYASATISNTGTLDICNATVTSKASYAIDNAGEWNSSYTSYIHGRVYIREGCTITSQSATYAAINNSGNLDVYGGTISGYIGIRNSTSHSGTSENGGKCCISAGTVTGSKCAILNSGSTSTKYQNGVPVKKEFSRGILEISQNPALGKVILEYPESLIINNCSTVIDIELVLEDIVPGDTISKSSSSKLYLLNLLNEGYVLLYDYSKGIYLDTDHCGATSSDDLHWKITPDGKLTIYGTGKMKDYSVSSQQPWNKSKTMVTITSVVMEPGITHIGSSSFSYLDGLTRIVIPEGVATTGAWVFEGTDNLEEVHLPSTLTSIGRCFFATVNGTEPPDEIYYNGCEHQWENVFVDETQPAPVTPICLLNQNTDDGDCTTALICSVCQTVLIPARDEHTGGTPTCTELAKCDICGMAYGEFGHEPVIVPAVAPNCENTGLTEGSYCALCQTVLKEQIAIPALGHSYTAVTTPPTCAEQGFTTHTCHCGAVYTDDYKEALGHYVLHNGKELVDSHSMENDAVYPFVLSNGWYASSNKSNSSSSAFRIYAIYDCTLVLQYKVSSETKYDKLQILVNGAVKETASGEIGATTYTAELKAGDILSIKYSKDSSVSKGADTGYFMIESCTQTELEAIVQIPAEEAEPTCMDAVVCERCSQIIKPALGHDEVIDAEILPSCTETGLGEGIHCQRCMEILIAQEVIPATGHSWKNATCTDPKICTVCASTEGLPTGHEHKAIITEPTCTEKGYATHTCHCGDSYVDSYKDALGHTGGTATCVDQAVCTRCEKSYGELDPDKHAGETEIRDAKESTCTGNGYTGDTYCLDCNEKIADGKTITPTGHKMSPWETSKAPTCTETGIKRRDCEHCDYFETDVITATGHAYNQEVADEKYLKSAATCTAKAVYYISCQCGIKGADTFEYGEPNGHDHKAVITEPDCIEMGYTTYTCACGDSYVANPTEKLGHTGGTATCVDKAVCTRCEKSYGELNPDNHAGETEIRDAKEATCTENGYSGDTYCLDCGELITKGEEITSPGHDMGDWVVVEEASCTEDGSKRRDCSRCDHFETATIEATGHDHKAMVADPTCTEKGYTIHTCHCGDTYTDSEKGALGHDMGDWETTKEPSTTEEGEKERTCKREGCSYKETEKIPVLEKALWQVPFANMTLGNELAINFAFAKANESNWDGCYAKITKTYANGTEVSKTIPSTQWGNASVYAANDHFMITFNGIAAKEMSDKIYVTIYNAAGEAISERKEETIRAYAMRCLNSFKDKPETRTMVVDMLNYGAAAQEMFGYNEGDLANSGLSEEQKSWATASASKENSLIRGNNYAGSSLVLEQQILMMMAFQNVTEGMYAKVQFVNHYNQKIDEKAEMSISGGFGIVSINQIVVADARIPVTVTVYKADGSVHGSATDSMEGYIARVSDKEPLNAKLYEKILMFADSTYNYLH